MKTLNEYRAALRKARGELADAKCDYQMAKEDQQDAGERMERCERRIMRLRATRRRQRRRLKND